MFNNPFLKKDPLLEAVKSAQAEGSLRRQAEALVNEEFGVYSRNAVVREQLAAYDARLEEAYKCMKEGEKLAKKDYDKDGKIESPKDEVWGSRFRAAKMAGKMEEEQIDEISKGLAGRYKDKAHASYTYSAGKRSDDEFVSGPGKKMTDASGKPKFKERPKEAQKADDKTIQKRLKGLGMAHKRLSKEETQIDEISKKLALKAMKKSDERGEEEYDRDMTADRLSDPKTHWDRAKRLRGHMKRKFGNKTIKTGGTDNLSPKSYEQGGGERRRADKLTKGPRAGKISAKHRDKLKDNIKYSLGKHKKPNLPEEAQIEEGQVTGPRSYKGSADRKRKAIQMALGRKHKDHPDWNPRTNPQYSALKLGRKLQKQGVKEDSSFNAAQVTGKSVNEVVAAMAAPPAIVQPAVPGVKQTQAARRSVSTSATARFGQQGSGPVSATPKVSRSYSQGGANMVKGMAQAGREAATTRAATLGGMNPMDRAGGPISSAAKSTLGGLARGALRVAGGPVVGGVAAAMQPTPANKGENEFARQERYKTPGSMDISKQPAPVKGPSASAAEKVGISQKPAPSVVAKPAAKQTFSQAFAAARKAGGSKAQFEFGGKKFQAAATKKEYVPASKQSPVNTSSAAASTPAPAPKATPAPTPKATPAPTPKATSNVPSAADQMKAIDATPKPDSYVPKAARVGRETTSAPSPEPKAGGFSSAPVVQSDKFQRDDKKKTDAQPMQESYVFVGDNKYRIV